MGGKGGGEGLKNQSYAVCASRLLIKHYCLISLLSLGCKTSKTWSLHLAWWEFLSVFRFLSRFNLSKWLIKTDIKHSQFCRRTLKKSEDISTVLYQAYSSYAGQTVQGTATLSLPYSMVSTIPQSSTPRRLFLHICLSLSLNFVKINDDKVNNQAYVNTKKKKKTNFF